MYTVKKGKELANVNGTILGQATQDQLKKIHSLGHPYILQDEQAQTDTDPVEEQPDPPKKRKRKDS